MMIVARYRYTLFIMLACAAQASAQQALPANGASGVNPDTHLVLTFAQAPQLGRSGQIRIYDAADKRLVDTLDLGIPDGPTERTTAPAPPYLAIPYPYGEGPRRSNADTKPGTPSAGAEPVPGHYQLTIIGGFTDGFHFHPVIVHDKSATIYPHNNLLEYGKTYYVQIDPNVLTLPDHSFHGIAGDGGWRFSTKSQRPSTDKDRLVVSADGSGDFNTVQGAVDFAPDHPANRLTIFIRNGDYEEIVYFRNKHDLTFLGEDRDKVRIHYANNETFNPHPANIGTNELPGTFPSRRAAFAVDHSSGIALVNLTLQTTLAGQAEGLLMNGGRNIASHVTVIGSGDALQVNDSVYFSDVKIVGRGDTILGRGPAYFRRCEIESEHAYMWIRNPSTNHGNVFVGCRFDTSGGATTEFAREPANKGMTYPHAEAVLIDATLSGISPAGWGEVSGDASQVHFWEYNSRNADGTPLDARGRNPISRQLDPQRDAATIASYRDPAFVLDGWQPSMAPLILKQPTAATVSAGTAATLQVSAAAVPDASYQWFKNGKPIADARTASLSIQSVAPSDAGAYSVRVDNASGGATSTAAQLVVH
ncbi:MAG TPA: pectinesterase family protein [Caballeronia sp.]|nr:pectinesterase family protein [Caballeronia sp.]